MDTPGFADMIGIGVIDAGADRSEEEDQKMDGFAGRPSSFHPAAIDAITLVSLKVEGVDNR